MSSLLFFATGLQMKSIIFRIFCGVCLFNIDFVLHVHNQTNPYLLILFVCLRFFGLGLLLSSIVPIFEYLITKLSNQDNPVSAKPYENNKTIVKINAIISELSNLQQEFKNKNLNLDIFIKFNLLHDKFKTDLQTTQDVVGKLQTIGQNDNPSYVKLLDHYLDLFNEQKQIIYHKIQQQCNEELDKINNQLHNFNEIIDKTV